MFKTTTNMMLLSAAQNAFAHKMLGKPLGGSLSSDRPEEIPEDQLVDKIDKEKDSGRYNIGRGKG